MFDKLAKAAIGTVLLPVEAVKDVVTFGGELTDKRQSYTGKRLEQIEKNIDKALD